MTSDAHLGNFDWTWSTKRDVSESMLGNLLCDPLTGRSNNVLQLGTVPYKHKLLDAATPVPWHPKKKGTIAASLFLPTNENEMWNTDGELNDSSDKWINDGEAIGLGTSGTNWKRRILDMVDVSSNIQDGSSDWHGSNNWHG